MNNCVGAGNHSFFLSFLISVFLTLALVLIAISVNIKDYTLDTIEIKNRYLEIFPDSWYKAPMFLFGVVIIYLIVAFFLLPVG